MRSENKPREEFIRDCIGWDVVNWSKALSFWERHADLQPPLSCLELGGQKGGLSLWLAEKGHLAICSDLENPAEKARTVHEKYPFYRNISYQAIDAMNIPYTDHFDLIAFKSILGGIARDGRDDLKQRTVQQIHKALKPGGKLLFAENLTGSRLHMLVRKKMVSWGGSWNYLNLADVDPLFRPFESVKYATAGFLGTFGRTERQRRLLSELDILLLDKMLPDNYKYIVFGVAVKHA